MIKITDITPFMRNGWVAMDKSHSWWWYSKKPELLIGKNNKYTLEDCWFYPKNKNLSDIFNIAPADDWTKSLLKVGGK